MRIDGPVSSTAMEIRLPGPASHVQRRRRRWAKSLLQRPARIFQLQSCSQLRLEVAPLLDMPVAWNPRGGGVT